MKEFLAYLYPKLKDVVEISALMTKFLLGFGILLITWHFMNINYFPKDLAFGDGLIFILITAKFLILVVIFILANYTIGRFFQIIYFLIKSFFNFLKHPIRISRIILHRFSIRRFLLFDKPIKYLFFFCSIYLIISFINFYDDLFAMDGKSIIINVIVLIFSCVLTTKVINWILLDFKSTTLTVDEKNKKVLRKFLLLIMIAFLYIINYQSTRENRFLSFSSSLVREQNNKKTIIYVKKDYKDFFPDKSIADAKGDYIPLKNVEVVLRGIGKNALLKYRVKLPNNKYESQKIEIPNDALLIVRKD